MAECKSDGIQKTTCSFFFTPFYSASFFVQDAFSCLWENVWVPWQGMTAPGHSWKCLQGICGRQYSLQLGKTKNLNILDGSSSPHGEVGQSWPGHLINQLFFLVYFRMWWNQSFLGDQIHYLGPGIQSSQAVCKTRRNLASCDLFNTSSSCSSTPANFAFE